MTKQSRQMVSRFALVGCLLLCGLAAANADANFFVKFEVMNACDPHLALRNGDR
jgi:hypothetical protein